MIKMNKPNITLHDVFTSCTENMNDENKNKYRSVDKVAKKGLR